MLIKNLIVQIDFNGHLSIVETLKKVLRIEIFCKNEIFIKSNLSFDKNL